MAIDQVISDAANKLIQAIEAYGPKATVLVLETGRLAALQELISGAVLGAIAIGCFIGAKLTIRELKVAERFSDEKIGWGSLSIFLISGSLVTGCLALAALTNVFAWTGLNHPEIYLAAKLLKL